MKKEKQNIHGIFLLDKATGMSSNQALQKVKSFFNAKKAGHTGSLDPLATGLLPICLGQATKVSEYLLHSDKKYTTVIRLGETTDTLDSEGEILQTTPVNVSDLELQAALSQFRGEIQQVPPMYSALKNQGQPLYKLARQGKVIERPARTMTVFDLQAERLDDTHVQLQVHCSSGFYIRSLAHDLGQVLGCGAHVVALRRTAIKQTGVEQALTLQQMEQAPLERGQTQSVPLENGEFAERALLPIDCLIMDMPVFRITDDQVLSLLHGKTTRAEPPASSGLLRLYTAQSRLFGIGQIDQSGLLKTHKMFITDD